MPRTTASREHRSVAQSSSWAANVDHPARLAADRRCRAAPLALQLRSCSLSMALPHFSSAAVQVRSGDGARAGVCGPRHRGAALGIAQRFAPHVAPSPVKLMGLSFPNRVGLAAGTGQERSPHRRPGAPRFRVHRMRHGDSAAAARKSQAADFRVPEAEALINRTRVQQPRRRSISCQRHSIAFRQTGAGCRNSGPQHRQEFRYAEQPRRKRLPWPACEPYTPMRATSR